MPLAKFCSRSVIACAGVFIWTQLAVSTLAQDSPGKDSSTIPAESSEPQAIAPFEIIPSQLMKKATVKFENSTLLDLEKWLESETGLSVSFDESGMEDMKLSPKDSYEDRLLDQPIYLLLNRLSQNGLGWYMEESVIQISSQDDSWGLQTKLYSVGDLIADGYTRSALVDVVQEQTSGPWFEIDTEGGDASLLGDILIVRQTFGVQIEVAQLLNVLHSHGSETSIPHTLEETRIRKILKKKLSVDFHDIPLSDSLKVIANRMNLDIRLNVVELANEGMSPETPVSLTREKESLESILKAFLDDLSLTYRINDGILWIDTIFGCGDYGDAWLYDVSDLCRDEFDNEILAKLIMEHTSGPWFDIEQDGGDIMFPKPDTMIVRQDPSMRDEIHEFLHGYREVLRKTPTSQHSRHGDLVITLYYKLETNLAERLSEVLWELIPNSRQRIDAQNVAPQVGKIIVVPSEPVGQSTMIITHRRRVHHQIRKVIDRIKAGDPPLGADKESSEENESGRGFGGGQQKGFF